MLINDWNPSHYNLLALPNHEQTSNLSTFTSKHLPTYISIFKQRVTRLVLVNKIFRRSEFRTGRIERFKDTKGPVWPNRFIKWRCIRIIHVSCPSRSDCETISFYDTANHLVNVNPDVTSEWGPSELTGVTTPQRAGLIC